MTTLQAIGFTAAGGAAVCGITFIFFGVAVRARSNNVAPRATARSRDVIYNPKARRGKGSFLCFRKGKSSSNSNNDEQSHPKKNDDSVRSNVPLSDVEIGLGVAERGSSSEEKTREEVQYRGGPVFGWIPWTLSFSYDQLLKGIPGTGTRKNGMEGSMLKVNLDGIILLRFHAICLRVTFVATILGLGLILPLNYTARCLHAESLACQNSTLTNFEQTTLKNIPALTLALEDGEEKDHWIGIFGTSLLVIGTRYSSLLGRLYAVVAVSWVLVWYTIRLMKKEWVDALAMRRVYYLEGTHWENRVAELNETNFYIDDDNDEDELGEEEQPGALARRRRINKQRNVKGKKKNEDMPQRDPWIPHPEQRETVPNIELYSVLVGNIPSLPSEVADARDMEAMGFAKQSVGSLDWQLAITATFFDQCVPNQPGFSSSVAAVTILPSAHKLAFAWRMWYKHVGLLRRLRFIRSIIAQRKYYDIAEMEHEDELGKKKKRSDAAAAAISDGKSLDMLFGKVDGASPPKSDANVGSRPPIQHEPVIPFDDPVETPASGKELEDEKKLQMRIEYYNDVFGSKIDDEGELQNTLLVHALSYGPEQTAVYSREFAQGAAACCPNGCREERMHSLNLKQLEELEEEIKADVEESFKVLTEAQNSNIASKSDVNLDSSIRKGKEYSEIKKVTSGENRHDPDDIESKLYARTPTKFNGGRNTTALPMELPDDENVSATVRFGLDPSSSLLLTNQGKLVMREQNSIRGSQGGDDDSWGGMPNTSYAVRRNVQPQMMIDNDNNQVQPSRRRLNTNMSQQLSVAGSVVADPWEKVQEYVRDDEVAKGVHQSERRNISSGAWKVPQMKTRDWLTTKIANFCKKKTADVVEDFASESTFAVVTFTSRQAAIAARHCLADGRGTQRWTPVEDIPVPPLADAAAMDFKTCRGCCRPVTLTINANQQFVRKYAALLILAVMYVFYTIPLTFVSALVSPEKLDKLFPGLALQAANNPFLNKLLSGIVPAFLNSLFFALCPVIFKAISNFGSNAISVNQAEYIALQYYWFFMVVTAFSGTSLATMALNYFNEKRSEGNSFTSVLVEIAGTLPTQVSTIWLNWILFRTLLILPLQYMLQVNTFIFQWLGWKCCRRCVMGGGPGGPVPYRIYIDSGVVFMCVVALSPVSPLIAPVALLYFLYCAPLWRRNCIYMYRPKFDTGGLRWPFLSDVFITSMFVAQVLLTTALALKEALGPAVLSAVAIIPIILHRRSVRKRYLRPYLDAALLQTFALDGWDNTIATSAEKREEYRKFLVDAHKAAYVPICIAGGSTAALTAEPALVVPHENDVLMPVPISEIPSADFDHQVERMTGVQPVYSYDRSPAQGINNELPASLALRAKYQVGASTRRLGGQRNQMNNSAVMNMPDPNTFGALHSIMQGVPNSNVQGASQKAPPPRTSL